MAKPALGRILFHETDVTGPAALKPNDAYDLTLYEDASDKSKATLIVELTLQMMFRSGRGKKGQTLDWDHAGRQKFLSDYTKSISEVWSGKWPILAVSDEFVASSEWPATRKVNVLFKIHTVSREWYIGEHWELEVTKTDHFLQSYVVPFWGESAIDSLDNSQALKTSAKKPQCNGSGKSCAITQRGSAHEFGHMLGLYDEYPAAGKNSDWKGDTESIMHSGETVRPRHYAIFAHWLTERFGVNKKVSFKVDGIWDLKNSKLG